MIDSEEFRSNIAGSTMAFLPGRKTLDSAMEAQDGISSEELMAMCYHEVPGFSLVSRRWGLFDVDSIEDVPFNMTAFDELVLDQKTKGLIHSLVRQQDNDGSSFDDLIQGKGKGLVFLLHGPPGVGKTFTAGIYCFFPGCHILKTH